jgi:hypothetical protein
VDKSIILKHYNIISKYYPDLDITQLGLVIMMLGVIRASMGHEDAKGTLQSYIHKEDLSDINKECLDFLEREILSIRKSKIDIDFWKKGNKGQFREA